MQSILNDDGQAALAQYILSAAGVGDATGPLEGLSHNVGNFFTSTDENNLEQLIISLRYSSISIGADQFGLGAAVYKFFTS